MSDLNMDFSTNDILIANGDMSMATGVDAIEQDLQQRLQVWLGEWFLDTSVGLPYKQSILVKNPNLDVIQADFVNETLDTPGITQMLDFQFNYDPVARTLAVFIVAETTTGQTITAQAKINPPALPTIEGTPV